MAKIADKIINIPKKLWGGCLIVSGILTTIAFGFAPYIDKIEVGYAADLYHTLVNIFPTIMKLAEFKGRYIFIIIDFILLFFIFYKRTLFLICHQSMSYDLAKISKTFKRKYFLKENKLQQEYGIHSNRIDSKIIEDLDQMAVKAQKSEREIAYYGIAHTPLIFRLGFKIGDQSNVKLLHKKRSNSTDFEEWTNEKTEIRITPKEENQSKYSDELIVAISTSLNVRKEELCTLEPENKHIIYFVSNHLGFDSILSYDDAETLKADILRCIRDLVKEYKVKKIHMVVSSSVAFTFFLAQGYSAQHDPEIVVYHYEQGKYTWGINMNKAADAAYVKVKE